MWLAAPIDTLAQRIESALIADHSETRPDYGGCA
jgi:hypothetical protein